MNRLLMLLVLTAALLVGRSAARNLNNGIPQTGKPVLPELQLGDPVPLDAVNTGDLVVVSPAQMQASWTWQFAGADYILGVDNEYIVQYISTSSDRVQTQEGVHVGQAFAEVEDLPVAKLRRWPGWGHVAELPSGWNAAFFVGASGTESPPRPTDKVALLFRGTAAGYGAKSRGVAPN
jgi:hypothetical protein